MSEASKERNQDLCHLRIEELGYVKFHVSLGLEEFSCPVRNESLLLQVTCRLLDLHNVGA